MAEKTNDVTGLIAQIERSMTTNDSIFRGLVLSYIKSIDARLADIEQRNAETLVEAESLKEAVNEVLRQVEKTNGME